MKLPKEKTLWNWVFTGFGLILGVAIIGVMNFLNEYMNLVRSESDMILDSDAKPVLNLGVYYIGKIIAIISGCFTAGAIIKITRPEVNNITLIVAGSIFMLLSFTDLVIYSYPIWYQVFSLLVNIPSVLIGYRLIK